MRLLLATLMLLSPASAAAQADPNSPPEHAAMGHCTPAGAAAQPLRMNAPPPKEAFAGPAYAADTIFDPRLMAEKRARNLIAEHGDHQGYMILLDRLEHRAQDGRDGYMWDGDAWYGGDHHRLWLKSEGEGASGGPVEEAELQALYSRAVDPWFNLQAGIRYDIRPQPRRAHLVVGLQGLAPYWLEVDGALFLSDKGDLTARFEAEYDQRVTNRLIVQPRIEIDVGAQDVPAIGLGAGLSSVEAGLRLRYEIRREFAPYIGAEYQRVLGRTARLARIDDEQVGGWALVLGLRSWF